MKFLRSSFSIFSQDLVVTGVSFFSSIFLARWLGPEQLGLLFIINLIPSYSEKFGRIGNFDHAGVYFVKIRRYLLAEVVSCVTVVSLVTACIPIFLYALLADLFRTYVVKSAPIPPLYIWTAVISIPFTMLPVSYNKILIGEGRVQSYNVIQILKPVLTLALTAVFYFLGWNYYGVVLAGLVAAVVTSGYSLGQMRKLTPMPMKFRPEVVRDLFQYGWKIYFLTILNFIHFRADLLLVAAFLPPAQVSYYGMAATIGQMIWKIPNALSIVLFPKVAQQKAEDAAAFTARLSRMSFMFLVGLSLLLCFVAIPAVHLLYGARFEPAVVPLLLLMPGILTMAVGRLLMEHFYGQGHPRALLISSLISTPLNVLLNLFFIPRWGIAGAAVVSSITYTLFTGWSIREFSRRWGRGFSDLLIPTREDFYLVKERLKARRNFKANS